MAADFPFVPMIEVWRGALMESVHFGCSAVVDAHGHLLASAGDPRYVTYLRSSSKPMQALPFIEAGGAEAYHLSDAEIAILCSSHNGSAEHVAVIQALHEKMGFREEDLLCGTHMPGDPQEAIRLIKAGELPDQRHHNCSGKHTGMLAYAKLRGLPLEDYINPNHPIQQTILQVVAEMCGVQPAEVVVGTDGCSVPVFGLPMRQAAYGFARLADPHALAPERAAACRRITAAMISHPDMVAGTARFDTRLMQAAGGKLVCKGGAEGYFALGVMPGVISPGSPGIGITMKFADGALGRRGGSKAGYGLPKDGDLDHRGLPAAALALLQQLGILGEAEMATLSRFEQQKTHNWRRIEVGKIRANFTLNIHPS